MNKIFLFEDFAEDRAKRKRREAFGKLDDATKKKRYDAEVQLKKLKRKYPKEKFVIDDYYNDAKCVFLSTDSSLLNPWQRGERYGKYDDGLDKEFAKWLRKNNYDWSWHSPEGATFWDGIQIKPEDFEGLYWYYGEPFKEKTYDKKEFQKSALKAAKIFKEVTGLDVYPAEVKGNYSEGADRDVLEIMMTDKMIEDFLLRFQVAKQYNL